MLHQSIHLIYQIYTVMIFVRIISSWLPEFQTYKFMKFIAFYTDPYLNLFKKIIPPIGMLDISPVVALFCLSIIKNLLISILP